MPNQHIPVTGGCLCGAIRFESKVAPVHGYYCHCTMCQKAYGGLFSATVRFPGSAFAYTKGTPKRYRSSTFATRSFCTDCGSPMPFAFDAVQDVWVKIGTLDHPEDWPMTQGATWGPSEHLQVDFKVPWHEVTDGLPQMNTFDVELKRYRAPSSKTAREGS
jgi:hypothetical protein